jgi:hypothetical protein
MQFEPPAHSALLLDPDAEAGASAGSGRACADAVVDAYLND